MKLSKLLGIISIVIIVVFSMMLTTSYAWYSFENASTTFETVTSIDDVIISYQHGEYINTNIAVPISSSDIDKYSDKNNFNILVKDSTSDDEFLVTISLTDILIDDGLRNSSFRVELYHQSTNVASIDGSTIENESSIDLGTVTLTNNIANNFELRIYILDDGTDQSSMMNNTFQAKIKIDVVSRLMSKFDNYDTPDIYISSITIDGEDSQHIPTSGYYNMTSSCVKGGDDMLTWNPLSRTIIYNKGSYINDDCSLTFTSSTDYPLLNEMPVGSYVKYIGNNGCEGRGCEGYNVNYVNDTDMGYCYNSDYKFNVNGWRIAYIENDSAYLVSAGSPECFATYQSNKSSGYKLKDMDISGYYYGSGYEFDEKTGLFSLTGITSTGLVWSEQYNNIINDTPYTCMGTLSSANTCSVLYETVSYVDNNSGNFFEYTNFERDFDFSKHISDLNNVALKYCNKSYAIKGECNSNSVWSMNVNDFNKMTNTSTVELMRPGNITYGYNNDMIDNGSYYWFASSIENGIYGWNAKYRWLDNFTSNHVMGVRPVIKLKSTIYVTGGTGTYADPYIILSK